MLNIELTRYINMKNLKLCFLSLLMAAPLSANAAENLDVKLHGSMDFQAGFFNSNEKNHKLSNNRSHDSFNTSAGLGVNAENQLENGFIYGADIAIRTTTKTSKGFRSKIYTETPGGRMEFGSDKSAVAVMKITPGNIAAGTGGMWDMWVKMDPSKKGDSSFIDFITNYSNFLDSKFRTAGESEYARKITYYTPKFYGFRVGVSYIPDGSNQGSRAMKDDSVKFSPIVSNSYFTVKDGVATAVSYENTIGENLNYSLVGTYEWGKVRTTKQSKDIPELAEIAQKTKNLDNVQVGLRVDYKDTSLAASYGDFQNSLLKTVDRSKSTKVYGGGIAHSYNDFKFSTTYFRSAHLNNKLNATSLAVNYYMAPGLKPYAEVTFFNGKGRHIENPTEKPFKHRGSLVILGTKVTF